MVPGAAALGFSIMDNGTVFLFTDNPSYFCFIMTLPEKRRPQSRQRKSARKARLCWLQRLVRALLPPQPGHRNLRCSGRTRESRRSFI